MTETVKPWGKEILVTVNDRYALKDIRMIAGTRSSLQRHDRKLETILVLSGEVDVLLHPPGGAAVERRCREGDSYTVEPGTVHRVTVIEDARLIEVSTPDLDDVVRLADDYRRQ